MWRYLSKFRLSDTKGLAFVWRPLSELASVGTTFDYVLTIGAMVLLYFLLLVMWLTAVRLVDSRDLACDDSPGSPDSEEFSEEKVNSSMQD